MERLFQCLCYKMFIERDSKHFALRMGRDKSQQIFKHIIITFPLSHWLTNKFKYNFILHFFFVFFVLFDCKIFTNSMKFMWRKGHKNQDFFFLPVNICTKKHSFDGSENSFFFFFSMVKILFGKK